MVWGGPRELKDGGGARYWREGPRRLTGGRGGGEAEQRRGGTFKGTSEQPNGSGLIQNDADGENLGEELTGVRERYRRRFGDGKGWKADGGTRPSGGARRMTPRRRGVEASAPGKKRGRGGARSSSSRVHARTGSSGARRRTTTTRAGQAATRRRWWFGGNGATAVETEAGKLRGGTRPYRRGGEVGLEEGNRHWQSRDARATSWRSSTRAAKAAAGDDAGGVGQKEKEGGKGLGPLPKREKEEGE
uniref:EBNA1-like protein n=1 Tax=Oryza sativa subsp. japonica TaxID=39947 RepID=Q67UJ2_ORYSJ|nr:EBNA1-like protein [Oryza sativa Japonica Group]